MNNRYRPLEDDEGEKNQNGCSCWAGLFNKNKSPERRAWTRELSNKQVKAAEDFAQKYAGKERKTWFQQTFGKKAANGKKPGQEGWFQRTFRKKEDNDKKSLLPQIRRR